MDWRNCPSLPALRAFEAAVRCGSFSAAAAELNVTHAAIAQHVRTVEAHLDKSLMYREGRGVAPTEAGAALAATLTAGFRQIIEGVQAANQQDNARPLMLSVTPSFAENWLMPRLTRFWSEHPGFSLSVSPSNTVVDLRRDGIDLAIRYGRGDWKNVETVPLVAADFTVVAAPSLAQRRKVQNIQSLSDMPWLFQSRHQEARRWAENAGLNLGCCQMHEVATGSMLLSGARAGGGVAVVPSALIEDDIATGRLVTLMQEQSKDLGYYIVHTPGVLSARAKTLKSWLLKNARKNPKMGT